MPAPNIILFLSDQQNAGCVPGGDFAFAPQPNLAWVADRGTQYRRAYCASPICAPARATLLSGKLPSQTGLEANYSASHAPAVPEGFRTMGHVLGDSGYETAYCGKWHVPSGAARPGFANVLGRLCEQYPGHEADDDSVRQSKRFGVPLKPGYVKHLRLAEAGETGDFHGRATKLPLSMHPATQMAQRSGAWLRAPERRDRPFLLAHSMIEPHPLGPVFRIAPAPFDRMIDPRDVPLPATLREPGAENLLQGVRNYNGLLCADGLSDDEIRDRIAGYLGAVCYVDFLLGVLIEALAANDLLDNTIIVFTSDHGEMLGNHRMLKKGPVMYEDLVRIPLVASDPRSAPVARFYDDPVSHVDLLPTFARLAGASAENGLPGMVLPGLAGAEPVAEPVADRGVVVQYHSSHWGEPVVPLRTLITRDWKLVVDQTATVALYCLAEDPLEQNNLAGKAPDQEARLRQQLVAECAAISDPWPKVPEPEVCLPLRVGNWEKVAMQAGSGTHQ